MYNDQIIIRKKLESDLAERFNPSIKENIALLINSLSGKDTFVDKNLFINLQNILSLTEKEANYFTQLSLELAQVSAFAPVLLLEKIPILLFYGLVEEVGAFLSSIKNYGARAVSLFLGSDQLKTDDLMDILEKSTMSFYKTLLSAVNERHADFGVCCAIIMRASANIETVIKTNEINDFLNLCATLIKRYDWKMTEQYIQHAHEFITFLPLAKNLEFIESWATQSLAAIEFIVTYPKIYFATMDLQKRKIECIDDSFVMQLARLEILKSDDYAAVLNNPFILDDSDFAALILNWPILAPSLKANILFQLEHKNYKSYILLNSDIANERNTINNITNNRWLESWCFADDVIDLTYIRKRMGSFLQKKNNFSLEAKSIVKKNSVIFDRSNTLYTSKRVKNMLDVLLSYCINENVKDELSAMQAFLLQNYEPLKELYSKSTLVIQAWERNPWRDYGRSDELYSCTSLGDYNAVHAPAFLADLNINNLDVWSNGVRVGRIHLALVKDIDNKPLLLLDCVDGTERMIASKKKYELIMEAILAYARWINVTTIKVNYDVDYNTTPKKFISYVESNYKNNDRLDFLSRFLKTNAIRKLIPYPCQTFLESFIKSNSAFVRGAVIAP